MIYNKKNLLYVSIIFLLVLIDVFLKYLVFLTTFEPSNQLFFIEPVKNYGSALGVFSNISYYPQIVAVISILLLGFLIWKLFFSKELDLLQNPLFLITLLCGILGNTYDRIVFGYVRDIFGINNLFVFNVADIYLTFACIYGAYLLYLDYKSKKFSSKKKAKI